MLFDVTNYAMRTMSNSPSQYLGRLQEKIKTGKEKDPQRFYCIFQYSNIPAVRLFLWWLISAEA